MSFEPSDDLNRAIERLTVQDVWRNAGLPDVPRHGNCVVKSPFRDDRKGKSFSICFQGRGFRDHADDSVVGGVWKFAQIATGKDGKELVELLIDWSGITRSVPVRAIYAKAREAAAAGEEFEMPKGMVALAKKEERKRQAAEAERRLWKERDAALLSKVDARALTAWSTIVRARFAEGWKVLSRESARIADWASGRGWPEQWVRWLLDEGLIAMPWLPWCELAELRAKRGKAFRVDAPRWDKDGALLDLINVGYHQQFFVLGEGGEPDRKQWIYVPWLPSSEKARGEFMEGMLAAEIERGARPHDGSRVPALPFCMGSLNGPRFLIIAEGQWDAVTFAGACGWLDSESAWPDGAAVMGVRGVDGLDVLLAYWGAWLRRHAPAVLVLADNDRAGMKWLKREALEPGQLAPPTFTEKLKASGVSRVHVMQVKPEHGKDFNDYYRAKKPTPAAMMTWLSGLGFISAGGQWAA